MTASAEEISRFHTLLAAELGSRVTFAVAVQEPETRWGRASRDSAIAFEVWDSQGVWHSPTLRDRGQCLALPIRDWRTGTLWVSWRDEWRAEGTGNFRLVSASWTFYFGTRVPKKTQLFRAEWLDTATGQSAGSAASRAPQPHWHWDGEQLAESLGPVQPAVPRTADPDVLTELPGQGASQFPKTCVLQEVNQSGVHFGMSGWRNPRQAGGGEDGQWCAWQWAPDSVDAMLEWALQCYDLCVNEMDANNPCPPEEAIEVELLD